MRDPIYTCVGKKLIKERNKIRVGINGASVQAKNVLI